jgi:hypothetical protein
MDARLARSRKNDDLAQRRNCPKTIAIVTK